MMLHELFLFAEEHCAPISGVQGICVPLPLPFGTNVTPIPGRDKSVSTETTAMDTSAGTILHDLVTRLSSLVSPPNTSRVSTL